MTVVFGYIGKCYQITHMALNNVSPKINFEKIKKKIQHDFLNVSNVNSILK